MVTGSALYYAISMEDARLIARLRRGERAALSGLWEAWADPIWAVCAGMAASRDDASAAFQALHRSLRDEARSWAPTVPVCCLLAATVCRQLARRHHLPQPEARPRALQVPPRPLAAHEIRAAVATIPGPERLILLADLFFECPLESLSGLLAVPEENLRLARAVALGRLGPGGPGKGSSKLHWRLACLASEDPPSAEADDLAERVRADPDLEERVLKLAELRDLVHAVLAGTAPDVGDAAPLRLVEAVAVPVPMGSLGGVLVGLCGVLAAFAFALVRPSPEAAFSGPLAAHEAAVGRAPGFLPVSDPDQLRDALVALGVPPSRAEVSDGVALRLKLAGGMATPQDAPEGVALYTLDGRPITSQTVVAAPRAGMPDESWEVGGARLSTWQFGPIGVVVVREPEIGRTRVFTSALPPGQLLSLLAYGLKIGTPL